MALSRDLWPCIVYPTHTCNCKQMEVPGVASTSSGGGQGSRTGCRNSTFFRREEMQTGVKSRTWPLLFICVDIAFVCFLSNLKATFIFRDVVSLFKSL